MRPLFAALVLCLQTTLGLTPQVQAQDQAVSNAVVRMPSHGGSATVIYTEKGRTYLLSCGHAFQGSDKTKPIKLDLPASTPGPAKKVGVDLVDLDYDKDLSLLELHDGPVEYVCRVAPHHHRPSDSLLSVGYDEMRMPPMRVPTHIVTESADQTFTREKPWHGRSGGALIDLKNKYVIGVVTGYQTDYPHWGVYVSSETIANFLDAYVARKNGKQYFPPRLSPTPAPCPWPE